MRWLQFWENWGLVPRLMLAVGLAIVTGGGVQTYLLLVEGAAEHSARMQRDITDTLTFLAPLVADQAILGEYAVIAQLLKTQVKKGEIESFKWTDKDGKKIVAQDVPDHLDAPTWFPRIAQIPHVQEKIDVAAGGVGYGTLQVTMTPTRSQNRLWGRFVKQLQIMAVTLFLMLQFLWLIFRGNLGILRMLADGANRFSQGDHAVRIEPDGAPEVRLAAEAFNNMANNTENLLASLSKSEAKNKLLATIVEQSSEAIWTKDLNGTITSWNSGAVAMFGFSAAEVLGQSIKVGQSTAEDEASHMERLMTGERFSYETKARTKSLTDIDIQVAVAPLVDDNNQCIGKIAVARDITQRKRSEEELRLAREAAETANHAKSSFLARMSHEIRTPMNGVLGMTELLLETGLTPTQRKYAETVQRSGKNLLGIINDVLDFSKIEAGKLELEHVEMDLRGTVEDVIELLAERAHVKGLELACNIPPEIPTTVRGDPLRLGQILTNLAGNAIKFTEHGAVVVSVALMTEAGKEVTLRFEVTDTGTGISAEAQTRIFDDFAQADGSTTRKHGGSGLGLAISKQLVEMMGGGIHVESTVGVGSTFWFTAKFNKVETESRPESSRVATGKLAGLRALIIESSAISRGILHSQISSWGVANRVAETPEQAIELLTEAASRGVPYDLAIIDLGAGIDTLGVARTIKANALLSKTRLVMLSPVGRHADLREARNAGIDACLVKPVRQTALYECLATVMTGSSDAPAIEHTKDNQMSETPPAIRGNLLLAEDNLTNQAVALGVLELEGYTVTVANNGKEALEAYAKGGFDLILMDCHMPEMDGFEATKKIREREAQSKARRIPIIALTANAMTQDREECLKAGMDDHLSKPYGRLQIREVLSRWMAQLGARDAAEAAAADVNQDGDALDREVLEQLAAVKRPGKGDLKSEVVGIYLSEAPQLVAKLKETVGAGDMPETARGAHTLRSSSANVGARRLSELCKDLENAARSAASSDCGGLVARIDVEFAVVRRMLTAQLGGLAA
jgi:PAS domain S-box-containing protein